MCILVILFFNLLLQGTEFMDNLSVALRYYIAQRLNYDPGWKNIKARLSVFLKYTVVISLLK